MNTLSLRPFAEIRSQSGAPRRGARGRGRGGIRPNAFGRAQQRWMQQMRVDPFSDNRAYAETAAAESAEPEAETPIQIESGAFELLAEIDDILVKIFSMMDWRDLVLRVRCVCSSWQRLLATRADIFIHTTIDFNELDVDRIYSKLDAKKTKETERFRIMQDLEKKHGIAIEVQQQLVARARSRRRNLGSTAGRLARQSIGRKSFAESLNASDTAAAAAETTEKEQEQTDIDDIVREALSTCAMQQDPIIPLTRRVDFRKILEKGWDTFGLFDSEWISSRLSKLEDVEQQLHSAGLLPFATSVRVYDAVSTTFNDYEYYPGAKFDWANAPAHDSADESALEEETTAGAVHDYNSLENYFEVFRRILYGDDFWNKGMNREVAMYYDLEVERRDLERRWLMLSLASFLRSSAVRVNLGLQPSLRERRLREVANPVLQWLQEKRKKAVDANEARNVMLMRVNFNVTAEEENEQNGANAASAADGDDIDEDQGAGAAAAGGEDEEISEVNMNELVFGYRARTDLAQYLSRQQQRRNQQNQGAAAAPQVLGGGGFMFGAVPALTELTIPRNDAICSLDHLDHYLSHVPDYYPRTLQLVEVFDGNLRVLKLQGIECDPMLLKGIILQLPYLESLSLLFTRVVTRNAAVKQLKKIKRISGQTGAGQGTAGAGAGAAGGGGGGGQDEQVDLNDPAQALWLPGNKDELTKISRRLRSIEIDQLVPINGYTGDMIVQDTTQSDVSIQSRLFLEWLVLLARRTLQSISITLNNTELASGAFSGWIRRFGLEFDNSLVGCLFPVLRSFKLREYLPHTDLLRRVSASDLSLFLAEVSNGTLQEIELLVSFNPAALLCDIVKMPHLRESLKMLHINTKMDASRINDNERDENQRSIRMTVASFGGVDSLRFKRLKSLHLKSDLFISFAIPRPSPQFDAESLFLKRYSSGLTRLVASCMIGPMTRTVILPGYDQALVNALWSCGKALKKLIIEQQFDGELLDTLATVAPPKLKKLVLGDEHVLRMEESGDYDRSQVEFLHKANHVQFSSLKNLFMRCAQSLTTVALYSTSVIKDESEVLAANLQRHDAAAQMRGGKIRALAEALVELQHPTALRELYGIVASDLDGCSDAEMHEWKSHFAQLKSLSLHRTITHNTIVKLAAGFGDTLEKLLTCADTTGGWDLFTAALISHKFTQLKELRLSKTWSFYIYLDNNFKTVLQKQEELELKQWQAIMRGSSSSGSGSGSSGQGSTSTNPSSTYIFKYRPIANMTSDLAVSYPFGLSVMCRLAFCCSKDDMLRLTFEGCEHNVVKKLVRKEYDLKHANKSFARMRRVERKQIKVKYLRAVENAVKQKLLRQFIQFEGTENEKIRDEWLSALQAEQDQSLDADIVAKVSESVIKLKTHVPPNSSVMDSDDEGTLYM